MDRLEKEREAFVFELRRRIRSHNLTNMTAELARTQVSVSTHLNNLSRFPTIPGAAREAIFRETFAAMKMESVSANKTGKEPAAV